MIPSWLCSLVVMSNMAPPSPGTMVYSTSAFFPMSKSWALILPTTDPTAEDSGTLRWKKPVNKQTSDRTQWTGSFIIITWHLMENTVLLTSSILYAVSHLPEDVLSVHRQAADMLLSEVSPVVTGMTLFNFDMFGHQGRSAPCNWLAQPVRSTNTRAQGAFILPAADIAAENLGWNQQTNSLLWLIVTYNWQWTEINLFSVSPLHCPRWLSPPTMASLCARENLTVALQICCKHLVSLWRCHMLFRKSFTASDLLSGHERFAGNLRLAFFN